ncbi:uncharacterized protein LOC126737017 isoform X2 [Anthonomus grandis grandis]|uniref:uncharacterized protein LOC126737017 isoform X2 n=1 Tax=Anthonomus grandis grandis TaxID=2921223 RepID=UPI0021653667|nr:uncharacterized protein LOC126737017 isoform X2 [Anthonomus grandis grandis]
MTTTTTIRKSYGNRKLYAFPEDYPIKSSRLKSGSVNNLLKKSEQDVNKLIKYIDDNIVGRNNAFLGPFGRRKVVFCDYAASGRSLQFIEEYILREVLPTYGNTHFTTSISSLQTTLFRQEARDIIRGAVNATDDEAVIFCGHGCIDALNKLIWALDVRETPVIFTGPSEHRDNLMLWQKTGAKIVRISETKDGLLDLTDLETQLRLHQNCKRQLIGCFSVASSVTGILYDDVACTILLHQYGALSFWDYNIGAPNVLIDMNPSVQGVEDASLAHKDAIYFSGHKFIGGVQTPGILIAKKHMFRRLNTCEPDGFFASNEREKGFELQEEGNCVAVIESIRFGLIMQLKETVSATHIQQRQEKVNKQMLQHIRTIPEIILLGNTSPSLKRVSIFSFLVRHPRGTFLHHNFVCAVLNDVFGIQARAGCPCSGAYAQELLGIDQALADQYENIILEDRRLSSLNLGVENSTLELLRPGFTRISLPYFINDAELAFVMEAVKMVATEGWKLLPQYVVDLETAEWRHHTNAVQKDRKWLSSIRYVDGKMTMNERRTSGPGLFPQSYSECLQTARNLFNRARKTALRMPYHDQGIAFDSRGEKLRWFMLQNEAQALLTSNAQNVKQKVPFDPGNYMCPKKTDKSSEHDYHHASTPIPAASNNNLSNNSGGGSPRHYSLPSLDDPKLLTCSSPVPYFLQDVNGLYYPHLSQPPVNFAVGESMSSTNLHLQQQNFARDRCFSLGHPTVSPPVLSPQTRMSLGMTSVMNGRQRQMSCGSQTELHSLDSDANLSPTHSLNILSSSSMDCSQVGRASPAPDLQTYVTEMTKELATNIKSEIREVISKVEDVLENTDSDRDNSFFYERNGSGSEDGRSDSISANEVAEYLEKISIEMANEVKSEIRDVVSAVDVFITPDSNQLTYSRSSLPNEIRTSPQRQSSSQENEIEERTPGSSSDTVIHLITSPTVKPKSEEDHVDGNGAKSKVLSTSTVASVSSQDSGINMSFHEQEHFQIFAVAEFKARSNSDSRGHRKSESEIKFSTLQRKRPSIQRDLSDDPNNLESIVLRKWSCPEKNLWTPTVQAISEYKMIRDGDKVMVCLSGGKDSLGLLHTLLQYQTHAQKSGLLFSIGAITVDPDSSGCDPCILIPHLKSLGVHYIIDDKKSDLGSEIEKQEEIRDNLFSFCSPTLRHRLYSAAKSSGYNVLAIGQHLDDLCENFLLSVFHLGKMRAMRAHYYIKEHDLRVIRPLVYVRERALRQYATNESLPVFNSSLDPNLSKERQRIKQLLTQQEILFPKLFVSLKNALHPLIGFQIKACELKCRRLSKTSKEREIEDSHNETDEEPIATDD